MAELPNAKLTVLETFRTESPPPEELRWGLRATLIKILLPDNIANTAICNKTIVFLNASTLRKDHEELEVLADELECRTAILRIADLWFNSLDLAT